MQRDSSYKEYGFPETPWQHSSEEIQEKYKTDRLNGLTSQDLKTRSRDFGLNKLKERKKKSAAAIFINQFKNLVMLLLLSAAGLSFLFSRWIDGTAILAVILLNACIGFFMELKANRTMEALDKLDSHEITVIRNGEQQRISPERLLPGDLIHINSGDRIPADARILESNNLSMDESALTGESMEINKSTESIDPETVLAERVNMLFKGTSVLEGTAKAIVTATGLESELGRISSLIEEAGEEEDPLKKRIDQLGQKMILFILILVTISTVLGIIMQRDWLLMLELAIALAVAAVPEGLPIVESLALAKGMQRMAGRKALVRRLSAVQTLGSVTTIFTDKTGTLTENKMTVTKALTPGKTYYFSDKDKEGQDAITTGESENKALNLEQEEDFLDMMKVALLCNNASLQTEDGQQVQVGDPTEAALLVAGKRASLARRQLLQERPEEKEIAFNSDRKKMATIHKWKDSFYTAVKGAPLAVIQCSSKYKTEEGVQPFSEEQKKKWRNENEKLAEQGLRILAIAEKTQTGLQEDPYEELVFLGFICMKDPPRREVAESIAACRDAGIKIVMLTGDQKKTARTVGEQLGLTDGDSRRIYARITPEEKLDVISDYQQRKEIVAMTGDGVNDAPALKKADIGIAMGERGEEVAKDAADIILLDDSFQSIVYAVRYGRTVFNNIRKFVVYLISGNLGEILLVALSFLAGLPIPLLPMQILYLNMINDVFPALALGFTDEHENIMHSPPRDPEESIITKQQWRSLISFGILIALPVFSAYLLARNVWQLPDDVCITISFLGIALARLWHVFNMRDRDSSFFNNQVVKNSYIWPALAICILLVVAATLIPGINDFLGLTVLSLRQWILAVIASVIPLVLGQIAIGLSSKISHFQKFSRS